MRLLISSLLILALAPGLAAQTTDVQDDYLSRMEREHAMDSPLPSPAAETEPDTEVSTEEVVYAVIEGQEITGYLATPAQETPTAAIIVIQEWWGLNDNIRAMGRRLAGAGYTALAVDLYEGEVAETRDEAARLARAGSEQSDRLKENLRQAWSYLKERRGATRIGVIGWCFGGGWSLQTALMLGDGIDATVVYYGRVVTEPEALEPLSSPLLGIFGAADEGIPVATAREFQASLDALGKDATVHIYEGADHAFANPSGTRYNEAAAEDAWAKTLAFFDRNLR